MAYVYCMYLVDGQCDGGRRVYRYTWLTNNNNLWQ